MTQKFSTTKRALIFLILTSRLNATVTAQDAGKTGIDRQTIEARAAEIQKTLGDSFRQRSDEKRKILVLSDLPDSDINGHLDALRLFQDALHTTLFEHLPDYWILVVIPSSGDDYNTKLGGSGNDAGHYNPTTRTLAVNITTGTGSMIHEWTHAMNIADQTARRQSQPLWMLEGLGSLYEEVSVIDGRPVGLTNWRLVQLQTMIQSGSVRPMRDFIVNSPKYFEQDPFAAYAQARYIFYYLQEKGLLQAFYRAYADGYPQDATGIAALEKVLGKKVEDWVGEWKDFTVGLAFGDFRLKPKIGVQVTTEDNRLKIVGVVEGGSADKAGLRNEDLIIAADGQRILSFDALQKVLNARAVGDVIALKILRNNQELEIKITLQ